MLSPRSVSREIYARQMQGSSLLGVLRPAPYSSAVPIEISPDIPKYREPVTIPSKDADVKVADAKPSNRSPFKKLSLPGHHNGEPRAAGKAHISPQSARIEFEQARKKVKSPTVSVRNLANIGEGRSAPLRPSRRLLGPLPAPSTVAAMGLSPRGARVRGEQAVGIATRSRASHVINPDDSLIVQSLRAPIGGPEAWANAQRVRISHIFTNEDSGAQSPVSDRKARRLSDSYANSVLGSSRGMATALGGPDTSGIFNRPPSPRRPVGKRIVRGPTSVGQVRVVQPIVPSQGNDNPPRGRRVVEGSCKRESWTWSMKPVGRGAATPDLIAGG
ncbi:Kinesin-like protein kip2 [Perkinsus chesapeaki]|uniref:Kinesin-like protein kip2 n=1 Tax=Perkinsus chesapeaki TaxID=330153 RepID=A0A7J6MXQ9_PERCH|nr:Kinesin-like protein kip2 [Perkinsus chesapeaki]